MRIVEQESEGKIKKLIMELENLNKELQENDLK